MDGENLETMLVPEAQDNTDTGLEGLDAYDETQLGDEGQGEEPPAYEEGEEGYEEEPAEEAIPKSQYDNLRREFTRKSMELADIKRNRPTASEKEVKKAPATVQEFLQQQVEASLAEALAPIKEQQEDLRIQAKVKALSDEFSDFDDVADDFLKVLEENEELFDIPNGLDIAFRAARSAHLERAAEAKAIAAQEAKAEAIKSKSNLADTRSATKDTQAPMSETDKIKASILGAESYSSTFNF